MISVTVLALLGMALSGYLFSSRFIFSKYRLSKYQGHHLLYKCLGIGLVVFGLSAALFALTWPFTSQSSLAFEFLARAFPEMTQSQFNLYSILLLGIIGADMFARLLNRVIFRSFYILYSDSKNDATYGSTSHSLTINQQASETDPALTNDRRGKPKRPLLKKRSDYLLDLIVYKKCTDNGYITHVIDTFLSPSPLLLTLDTRRCYVCYPNEVKTPLDHQEDQELSIIPLCSGYRDDKDMCLELTTVYEDVLIELSRTPDEYRALSEVDRKKAVAVLESHKITISYQRVVSIASFDESKYLNFKVHENRRRKEIFSGRKVDEDERHSDLIDVPSSE
ncbi:hypothetical protein J6J34_01730 [Pseudidiomarina sp. 1ASP75-14]|uniref:hypothetical protein n=1 Tax=Pseudidiomarina terrestris TaxID=2820060 RepID=UPI002655CF6C|nr:hypothetical protein [Pseudidiomarina sp. 1ASP75-14]MDN7136940.1 hypothetical protein [Pseudidiomarina sp. 1ASP75-14]